MLSEQEINYRTSDVVPEVTKKHTFFKISRRRTPPPWRCWKCFGYQTQTFKMDWKALCTGGGKLNPFALPHRVVARARRLEVRRTIKVQLSMALHDSLFHMKNVVAKRPFLTVSDQVRLKLGCILYFGIRVII